MLTFSSNEILNNFEIFGVKGLPLLALLLFPLLLILNLLMNNRKKSSALSKSEWRDFPLIDILDISHDVKRFRFALQTPKTVLGLPVGQHISLKYLDENNEEVIRSYTPTSSDDELGYVDFVVKVYFKNEKFPNGGKMSQHLNNLKIGDTISMKGPKGHLDYKGNGSYTITKMNTTTEYNKKNIGMIAGGTGITPMLQVIRAILKNPNDKTKIWLVFANQTEEDILLRSELEAIPKDRLKLFYTLDRPPAKWNYGTGFINADMCRDHLPAPGPDTAIYICGPPPMIKFACEPALKSLGFADGDWFTF